MNLTWSESRRHIFAWRGSYDSFILQTGGDGLNHFMTLILVFMGSHDRMKNPHLRAELAETLAALMPQNPDQIQGRQGMMSK